MKKKTNYVLFVFALLIAPFFADAALPEDKSFNVSCVYNDGKVISKNYDDIADTRYAEIKTYPVRNSKTLEYNINGYRLLSLSGSCGDISKCQSSGYNLSVANELNYKCPDTFKRWLISETNGDERVLSLIYYHTTLTGYDSYNHDETPCEDTDNRVYCYLLKDNKTKWWQSKKDNVKFIKLSDNASDTINLVAERVTILSDIEANRTCTYVHEAKQGSGSNKYVTLYGYTDARNREPENALLLYLDDGQTMTSIDRDKSMWSCNEEGQCHSNNIKTAVWKGCQEYIPKICVKLSERELSQAEGSSEYTFTEVRHNVTSIRTDGKCPNGYVKYEFSGYGEAPDAGSSLLQICDSIPHTAIVLAQVLSWIQIIIPALVLIYTGIDIGRIVIAGNLEEELPKKKKSIIIRFVIMIAFFFIPFIIRMIMGTIYGTDVGAIDCLYENDTTVPEEDDEENTEDEGNGESSGGSSNPTSPIIPTKPDPGFHETIK